MRKKVLPVVASLGLLVGCAAERDLAYADGLEAIESNPLGNLNSGDAWLGGDIGALVNIDREAFMTGYDAGDYATLEVKTDGAPDGTAMHLIDVYGGLSNPALRPGASFNFRSDDYGAAGRPVHMALLACGTTQNVNTRVQPSSAVAWDTDAPAESMRVNVVEGEDPSTLIVNYEATIVDPVEPRGAQVTTGSFVLNR